MNPFSILLIGLAMSTDAFAAAVGKGAARRHPRWRDALRDDEHLRQGLNVCAGQLTYQHVAEALDLPYTPADALL